MLLLLVLAILAGLTLGLSAYVVSSTQASFLDPDGPAPEGLDCVLVLGCGVRPDGSPSDMLADRLEQGIALYQAGWADKLLLSGDNGQENYNEVGVMEAYALERGVPGEDIVLDHAGFCTYDSVYRARDIFGAKRLVIITQAYHLSRALYIAQALGLLFQGGLDGVDGGVLHQRDHIGGAKDRHQSAAHGGGGILRSDHALLPALHSNSD